MPTFVWVLCQHLFGVLHRPFFLVLYQHSFGYYANFCLECYVSLCLEYYVNICLGIISTIVWVLCQQLFGYYISICWGITSTSVSVLRQHLFGYLVSICLDIMSASVRESISRFLHLIEKFTYFYSICFHSSSLLIHILSKMNPFYILTNSSSFTLMLSTSDIRFDLPFGLSDENTVLLIIPCYCIARSLYFPWLGRLILAIKFMALKSRRIQRMK